MTFTESLEAISKTPVSSFLINVHRFSLQNICGATAEDCSWSLNENTMIISGNGIMDNYKSGSQPWYSERENIRLYFVDP